MRSAALTNGINRLTGGAVPLHPENSRILLKQPGEIAMTQDQRRVAIGALSGVAAMILLVWGLSSLIPAPQIMDTASDRLAYALRWATFPALLFFARVAAIGNARFASEAIDPTLGKESPEMVVDGRVAENTLQQLVLFCVGMLGLAVSLPLHRLSIVAAV